MLQKSYKNQGNVAVGVKEPAIAFKKTSSNRWNPNVPFTCTQEEFWEHIHEIERGEFMTIEEFDRKFEVWRQDYLANKLK